MSIVSKASKAIAKPAATAEVSEFDGFWVNAGVYMGEEEATDNKFVRLPRGIAVSDLKVRKVYETMDPEFAAQVNMMNEMITAIQEACLTAGDGGKALAEGQSIPIQLSCVLYRRQEEAEVVQDTEVKANVRKALFAKA
jgi:hypothetical protein